MTTEHDHLVQATRHIARAEEMVTEQRDLIDTLPPGLYEAVFEDKTEKTANPDLAIGNWVMRCEMRTLDDIRALGGNDTADERRFATAARVSETNLALYRTFAQPMVRTLVNPQLAQFMQQLHPLRLQYDLLSNANPFMAPVAGLADQVRKNRVPLATDNPFVTLQETVSGQIIAALNAWRDIIETAAERTFMAVYRSPALQAAVGIDPAAKRALRRAAKHPLHRELLQKRTAELRARIPVGGLREAGIRALIYAGMGRRAVDERGFEVLLRIRPAHGDMPLSEFKALVREQYLILLVDTEAALVALSSMLPADADVRRKTFDLIKQVLSACGEFSAEDKERLLRIARAFGVEDNAATVRNLTLISTQNEPQAKAS